MGNNFHYQCIECHSIFFKCKLGYLPISGRFHYAQQAVIYSSTHYTLIRPFMNRVHDECQRYAYHTVWFEKRSSTLTDCALQNRQHVCYSATAPQIALFRYCSMGSIFFVPATVFKRDPLKSSSATRQNRNFQKFNYFFFFHHRFQRPSIYLRLILFSVSLNLNRQTKWFGFSAGEQQPISVLERVAERVVTRTARRSRHAARRFPRRRVTVSFTTHLIVFPVSVFRNRSIPRILRQLSHSDRIWTFTNYHVQ